VDFQWGKKNTSPQAKANLFCFISRKVFSAFSVRPELAQASSTLVYAIASWFSQCQHTYFYIILFIYIYICILIEFSSCMFMSNSVKSKAGNPTLEVSILSRDFKSWECFISKGRICTHCTPFVVIRLCPNTGPCHLTLLGNLNRFGVSSCLFHNIADRATDYEVCHF